MRKLACASWLVVAVLGQACGEDAADNPALDDADLVNLRIQDVPCIPEVAPDGLVHICGLAGVVEKNRRIHAQNATQGPEAVVLAASDGSFDLPIAGAVDHVYDVWSEGADPLPLVRMPGTETVVRGYGLGFVSASGCELEGWSGIIREDGAGDARTGCAALGSIEGDEEILSGPVEPFVLRGDTSMAITASLTSVDGGPLAYELEFQNEVDSFAVPIVAQSAPEQFGTTTFVPARVASELRDRLVESMEIRAPSGSALIVADLTFAKVDPPPPQ